MTNLPDTFFKKELNAEYCSGIFSDELDKMGFKKQVVAGWKLNAPLTRCFGRIRTLTLETVECDDERIGIGLGFLDSLDGGDVLLVKGSSDFAYFGELMTRLSLEKQLAGTIIDGLTRDSYFTLTTDYPIFARGYTPRDIKGRGRVDQTDVAVEIKNVAVESGDYVFADHDAVVFVPKEIVDDLMVNVNAVAQEEASIKAKIARGMRISQILIEHHAF